MFCAWQPQSFAKKFMPSLDRLRNKVTNALASTTKESFKELLQQAGKESAHGLQLLGNVITSIGSSGNGSAQSKLKEIQKNVRTLYWCNNEAFMQQLQKSLEQSHEMACDIVTQHVLKKYSDNKAPLLMFATDLQKEEAMLQECTTEIFRLGQKKNKSEVRDQEFVKAVQAELENVVKLKRILDQLIGLVNKVLLRSW